MKASFKLLVIGLTLATMSASGIFSLTNDVIDIGPNRFESGQYGAAGAAHDVAIATVTIDAEACPDDPTPGGAYDADDSVPGAFEDGVLDLNPGEFGEAVAQNSDYCIKNFGTEPVALSVAVTSFSSTEVGACTTSEAAAGDSTCSTAAAGEFQSPDITFAANVVPGPGGATSCQTASFKAFDAPAVMTTYLEPGESCRFFLSGSSNPSFTEQQRLVRQTDSVGFMMQIVAVDGYLL